MSTEELTDDDLALLHPLTERMAEAVGSLRRYPDAPVVNRLFQMKKLKANFKLAAALLSPVETGRGEDVATLTPCPGCPGVNDPGCEHPMCGAFIRYGERQREGQGSTAVEVIEECARVADGFGIYWRSAAPAIAKSIRTLKGLLSPVAGPLRSPKGVANTCGPIDPKEAFARVQQWWMAGTNGRLNFTDEERFVLRSLCDAVANTPPASSGEVDNPETGKESTMTASLELEEMLIRHYGTPAEQEDQRQRYGLSDAELSAQIESDARAVLAALPTEQGWRDGLPPGRSKQDVANLVDLALSDAQVTVDEDVWRYDYDILVEKLRGNGLALVALKSPPGERGGE